MKNIRVLYDYQILLLQRYGGISRYFYELYTKMLKKLEVEPSIKCFFNKSIYFENVFNNKYNSKYDSLRGKFLINKVNTLLRMKVRHYDIVHPTYYDPYIIGKSNAKLVITVYDMIHEKMPEMFSYTDDTAKNKKQMIYAADHIIAISESTKRDILELYPDIPSDKISVIYIGSNFELTEKNIDVKFPEKYVLFVGNRDKYKNYERFYKAIEPILNEDSSLNLVVLGGGAFTENEINMQQNNAQQIIQMNVSDDILAYAYSHAECFVFPSLYEGFGIPTLEAFACNCPVILSNTSSMPEVGGDAVIYINPYDINDIREKIHTILTDKNLKAELIKKGQRQLKKFEWDSIVDQTIACYKKILEE